MIKYENHCCSCAVSAYPCIGKSCPNVDVPVYYCDCCDNNIHAEYEIEGSHYCNECTKEYLEETFKDMTIIEQAEILNIQLKRLGE